MRRSLLPLLLAVSQQQAVIDQQQPNYPPSVQGSYVQAAGNNAAAYQQANNQQAIHQQQQPVASQQQQQAAVQQGINQQHAINQQAMNQQQADPGQGKPQVAPVQPVSVQITSNQQQPAAAQNNKPQPNNLHNMPVGSQAAGANDSGVNADTNAQMAQFQAMQAQFAQAQAAMAQNMAAYAQAYPQAPGSADKGPGQPQYASGQAVKPIAGGEQMVYPPGHGFAAGAPNVPPNVMNQGHGSAVGKAPAPKSAFNGQNSAAMAANQAIAQQMMAQQAIASQLLANQASHNQGFGGAAQANQPMAPMPPLGFGGAQPGFVPGLPAQGGAPLMPSQIKAHPNAQFVNIHAVGAGGAAQHNQHQGMGYDASDQEKRRMQEEAQLLHDEHANKSNSSDSESLAAEWDRIMTDFMPDMIVTFKLASGDAEHFHQDVTQKATLIRGGFFESADDNAASISFQIVSPSGKIVYRSKKGEGLFKITTTEIGTYTMAVSNGHWAGQKFVTFVVGTGEEKSLTHEDVSTLDGNVRLLYRMLGDMETQSSYLWLRQKSHLQEINVTASQTYYALIVELVCTGIATLAQLNIIKRMVAHRRLF